MFQLNRWLALIVVQHQRVAHLAGITLSTIKNVPIIGNCVFTAQRKAAMFTFMQCQTACQIIVMSHHVKPQLIWTSTSKLDGWSQLTQQHIQPLPFLSLHLQLASSHFSVQEVAAVVAAAAMVVQVVVVYLISLQPQQLKMSWMNWFAISSDLKIAQSHPMLSILTTEDSLLQLGE